MKLSKQEHDAINDLKALGGRWPKSLWLFSASGTLHVMKKDSNNRVYHPLHISGSGPSSGGGVDPDYIVATIQGIENDGGDW